MLPILAETLSYSIDAVVLLVVVVTYSFVMIGDLTMPVASQ